LARKAVLDALRDELRHRNYLPILFDFEKPSNRDITETVSTLAHLARFVIADISPHPAVTVGISARVWNVRTLPPLSVGAGAVLIQESGSLAGGPSGQGDRPSRGESQGADDGQPIAQGAIGPSPLSLLYCSRRGPPPRRCRWH